MDAKAAVQRQFEGVTQQYAASTVFSRGIDLDAIAAEAAARSPRRALDVGTAAGHVAFALAPHAELVVGLDLTHAMLVQARERGVANLALLQGDVEALPFADDSYDLVTSRFCGHHFPNPGRFVAEAARVLRPGGQLLLGDVVAPPDAELDRWINHVETLRDPSHVRDHTVDEWHALLAAAGLRGSTLLEWRLDLDFDDWVRRQRTPPDRVAALRGLFADASPRQIEAFGVTPTTFQLHCVVIRAEAP